ncbi:MAG: hypothetical protein HY537_09840 [Deltaproteobacteria bacterium]|nr:hypothetical protein [Deltaproteobacteria bacterium]
MHRTCFEIVACLLLFGCVEPQKTYFAAITKNNFIPFTFPMSGVGTGTLVRGRPDSLLMVAPPDRCFPYEIGGIPTELRWKSDASLAETHYSATLDFNANINTIAQAGFPSITFKFEMKKIRSVDFEVKSATVEMLDQVVLQDFYQTEMTPTCRTWVESYPFVMDGLEVTEMSFVFRDSFGGKIEIKPENISQIVDFSVDIKWHIENNYTLVVTTPKFIGYRLARLRPQDQGSIKLVATRTEENEFIWEEPYSEYSLALPSVFALPGFALLGC